MRFKSKLVFAISLMVAVVLVAVMVSVLLLTHITNKPSTPAPIGSSISIYFGPTIYVVGPQSLIQRLVSVGIPQSKIAPTSLGQLPNLPNNSVVMIDWSVIKPYVAYGTVGGNITLNLTSPAVGLLANLFAKGDLVMVNVSRSEAPVAELLLSYTMAKGANIVVYEPNGARFYLVPMLEMPINSNYTLIGATAIETPYGVAVLIGPVSLKGLPNLLRNWLASIETTRGLIKLPITNQNLSYQNWDPCYAVFQNLASSGVYGSGGVYTSGNFTFLWDMNALESQGALGSTYGVQAVEDNYGDMFYYDSCILMKNSVLGSTANHEGFIDAELLGDVAYKYTYSGEFYLGLGQLHYLIGDFDMYKSHEAATNYPSFYNAYITDGYGQYEPTPTGFFPTRSFNNGIIFPPDIYVNYNVPASAWGGVWIDVSTTPYESQGPYYAYNLTWTFNYAFVYADSGVFVDGFTVGSGGTAVILLKNYLPVGTYWFYLPFNAEVETSCWRAWANTAWVVGFVAPSSNTVSINTVYLGYPHQQPSNAPSGTWISGYTNHCPSTVNLSGT